MKRFAVPLVSLMLVLAGCGNDSPLPPPTTPPTDPAPPTDPGTPPGPGGPTFPGLPTNPGTPTEIGISGVVTAPAGGDITSTYVFACAQSDTQCASAQNTTVDAAGAYSFGGLQAEPYAIFAFKDIDANNGLSNGDYFGLYSADGTNPTLVTPPETGINITLQIEGGSTPPPVTPDPPDIGTGGSVSGTVFPPAGSSIAGTTNVIACYYVDDPDVLCGDEPLSVIVEVQQPGSSVPYTVDNLQTGQYLMVAVADADGNGSFEDAGDFIGAYPSSTAPELVSPPDTGIDVQMITNSELEGASGASVAHAAKAAKALLNKQQLNERFGSAINTLY